MRQQSLLALRMAFRMLECSVSVVPVLFLAGCQKPAAYVGPPAPIVGVVESRRMSVPVVITPNGTTRVLEDVTIRARVRGFLTERHFTEGSHVKKGQLLLVIDEEPYRIALPAAQARQAEAAAALKKAEESKGREVAAAQIELDRA
jgi:membrane fusion protein, multidrug efflux system